MTSEYWLMETTSSFCPNDGEPVYLLGHDSHETPAFYVCFKCKFVGQVGVGPVELIKADYKENSFQGTDF